MLLRYLILVMALSSVQAQAQELDMPAMPAAEKLYQQYCAACHDGSHPRAPSRDVLLAMSPRKIYQALTSGSMQDLAPSSNDERKLLVGYLSLGNAKLDLTTAVHPQVQCREQGTWFKFRQPALANGWGIGGSANVRFIPGRVARLSRIGVKRLKLKWVFGFPDATIARAQPAIAGGALFIGSQDGTVYALDAESGCVHWTYTAEDEVRTAISISSWKGSHDRNSSEAPILYFGDRKGYVYAVNAMTGEEAWKVSADPLGPYSQITGAPTLLQDALYVPVSSKEEDIAAAVDYRYCCTFRGSVVALNARTGDRLWQTYTIPSPAAPRGKNARGVPMYGPSGAAIYHSPTIDEKRGLLYVASDNNYTPPDTNSNTIFAISLRNGEVVWKRQTTAGNVFNASCGDDINTNCPDGHIGRKGELLGFGAAPAMVNRKNGRQVLVAGQKNGWMWGLDPDDGRIVWNTNISPHPHNRGVSFGMAVDGETVFGSISAYDYDALKGGPAEAVRDLGLVALNGMTGEVLWRARSVDHCPKEHCSGYYSSLTAIPDVLFAPAREGFLRAFDSRSGRLLWEFDATQTFATLNGSTAHGGSFSGDGAVVANGNVYISSGNFYFMGGMPGNVLLAFSVERR